VQPRHALMKADDFQKRLREDRPMITVSVRAPADVIDDLKRVALRLGFSGYQPLLRAYVGQGLRRDLERLEGGAELPELTEAQLSRALPASMRRRLMRGAVETGEDVAALRRFLGLSQAKFARAMGISVHTLRNWEQDRRKPEGPAIALLRIVARHPRVLRENLESAA
jgi:DNA-binding transcriptional regulator YiaG